MVESGTPQLRHFCPLTLTELLDLPLHLQLLESHLLLVDDAHHGLGKLVALLKYSSDALNRLCMVSHKIAVQLFEILSQVRNTFMKESGSVWSCQSNL